ncbi:MAG: hypothetical protein AAF944_28845 [Bacteroidota bacterium]
MRKIDYTRKPKKAFGRIKEVYGEEGADLPKSPNPEHPYGVPTSFAKHSYQPFFKTRPYRIIKWVTISSVLILIAWFFLLKGPIMHYQRSKFEESAFTSYYKTELADYSELLQFLKSRTDQICYVGFDNWENSYDLTLQHFNTQTAGFQRVNFSGGRDTQSPDKKSRIDGDHLIVQQADGQSAVFSENWVYTINDVKPDQIPTSAIDYLHTTQSEFSNFLNTLKQANARVWIKPDSVVTHFQHPEFGYYDLVYSTKPLRSTTEINGKYAYQTFVGKLDEDIYWIREDRILRSEIDE